MLYVNKLEMRSSPSLDRLINDLKVICKMASCEQVEPVQQCIQKEFYCECRVQLDVQMLMMC